MNFNRFEFTVVVAILAMAATVAFGTWRRDQQKCRARHMSVHWDYGGEIKAVVINGRLFEATNGVVYLTGRSFTNENANLDDGSTPDLLNGTFYTQGNELSLDDGARPGDRPRFTNATLSVGAITNTAIKFMELSKYNWFPAYTHDTEGPTFIDQHDADSGKQVGRYRVDFSTNLFNAR